MKIKAAIVKRFFSVSLLLILMLASCNAPTPHFPVLLGNYAFRQGDYQEATVHYLKALNEGQFPQWIQYNLANVYHSLGEFDAALELWDKALETDSVSLLFAIHYNKGILFYERGQYEEAFESFKTALSQDPTYLGAKLNLELTLLKLQSGKRAQIQRQLEEDRELSAESIRIFEYIRRKEEQIWVQQSQNQPLPNIEDW